MTHNPMSDTTNSNWVFPHPMNLPHAPSRTAKIDATIRDFAQRLARGALRDYEMDILAELIRERAQLLRRV